MKRIVTGFVTSAVVAFAATVSGCKEDTIIKSGLIPAEDKIEISTRTLTMTTKTVIVDTLNTSINIASQPVIHAAGTVVDPIMGTTTAGIYFQVLPTTNQFSFPDNGEIDSAFLILPYANFKWGDTIPASVQTFTVHRTRELLDKSTKYLSNEKRETNEQISQPFTFNPKTLGQTVSVLGGNRPAHLRIPLDITRPWFTELRDQSKFKTTSSEFLQLLRGLYVASDPGANSRVLPYFYLDGVNDYERAAIQFFYSTDSVRSFFFNFVRGECAHYNYITRDVQKIEPLKAAGNTNEQTVYLQNEPGAAIEITIADILNLPVGIMNSAILEISQVTTGNTGDDINYAPPTRLVPYVIAPDSSITVASEASGTLGGNKEEFSFGGLTLVRYRINIANTLQKAITGKWNMLHLRIVGAKGFPAAYRLVAGGRNHPNLNTKLRIFYSKPQ